MEVNPLDGQLTNRKTGYPINKKDANKIEAVAEVKAAKYNKEAVEAVKMELGLKDSGKGLSE